MKTKEIGHIKTKEEISEILNSNDLTHYQVTYHGCKGIFIPQVTTKIVAPTSVYP